MSFGATIKKLRHDRDMTQEELAEILSISPQAVSRWETDVTMPDIALLPTICNLFGVSSDFLLGINVEKREEQVTELRSKANEFFTRGYFEDAARVLAEAMKKYPDNYSLMFDAMYVASLHSDREPDGAKKRSLGDEVLRLGERILDGCTDSAIRNGAIQNLCYTYAAFGMRDRARALAMSMPNIAVSRECLLPAVEVGTAYYEARLSGNFALLQLLENGIENLNCKLDSGEFAYTSEEMAALREKTVALIELMFENGDYGFFNIHLWMIRSKLAKYYAREQDREKALFHIEKAAESAILFIDYLEAPDYKYTSLIFRGMAAGTTLTTDSDNTAKRLLGEMKAPLFDFIREDPAFIAVTERLEACAGKWEIKA